MDPYTTVRPQPSASASAPRALLAVAVSAVALLLWFPAASSARTGGTQTEQGESQRTALISAGLLGRWAGYGTGHGSAPQMSAAYSAMVRSLENFPELATFKTALRAQPSTSVYKSTSRRSASR